MGMTHAALAELLEVTTTTVRNWQRTGVDIGPTRRNLNALSQLTGATIDWIEFGTGAPLPPPSRPANGASSVPVREDIASTDNPGNPTPIDTPDRQWEKDVATAAIEASFLVALNRAPTTGEKSLLLRSSLELAEARRVLARFHRRLSNGGIPNEAPNHTDAPAFAREPNPALRT